MPKKQTQSNKKPHKTHVNKDEDKKPTAKPCPQCGRIGRHMLDCSQPYKDKYGY